MAKSSYVYILTNRRNGAIYTGVTSGLLQRIWQHKHHLVEGFTKRYNLTLLVWYEAYDSIDEAIRRERQIQKWPRTWKLDLIKSLNPRWKDLYQSIIELDYRLRGNDEGYSTTK